MTRRYLSAALLAWLALMPAGANALTIKFVDRMGKEITVNNAGVDEAPDGITIKKGQAVGGVRLTFPIKVSPANIRDYQMTGDDVAPFDFTEFRGPLRLADNADRAVKPEDKIKLLRESLPLFTALIPKLTKDSQPRRYVEFRHAQVLHRLSQLEPKDTAIRDQTAQALAKFHQDNPTSWQVSLALTMLAGLQEDQGDLAGVQKTYESLAAVPGLSEELKVNSLLSAARVLMKTDKFTDARNKLKNVEGMLAPDNPLRSKVQVYMAQCQILSENDAEAKQAEQDLRKLLTGSDDKALKALAHNTLGDYYTKLKRDEDAFWEYLRVDTLYSEDRFEHARAMYHLIRLFREVKKDGDRADSYRDLLTKNPRFTGLEYAKKALQETKKD